MSENLTEKNVIMLNTDLESVLNKTDEGLAVRVYDCVTNTIKNIFDKTQVLLGTVFTEYLNNAFARYNKTRTLATGTILRPIIEEGSIYVDIGVSHNGDRIDTETVDTLLEISDHLLVLGTGGIGKTMMMRHLFLDTIIRRDSKYIPVLLNLRKISAQASGKISILDLIYSCLEDLGCQLPREQFEFSLRHGNYLFLMDGFDEITEALAEEAAEAIQSFCSKYSKNPCIITSRPRWESNAHLFETFTFLESMPLKKEQAIELASKLWEKDEKTEEFCRQLDDVLFEKHRSFAENPLLLSMMFLTFMQNNSIPDHLVEFYEKAFQALYNHHDSRDKGKYKREFSCNELDETGFKRIFSRFCFQSYFKETYEFTEKELTNYLEDSIKKLGYTVDAVNYLKDLHDVVCLIIREGNSYRFAHRSFQTYFAAHYTSNSLTDEQQEKVFDRVLDLGDPLTGIILTRKRKSTFLHAKYIIYFFI